MSVSKYMNVGTRHLFSYLWWIAYLKARFLKQNYLTKGKKLQELWSFLHFRWLHFCHPPFSRLSTYSWPPRLRHRIYELSICRFHNYIHWMWHLQGQKSWRFYLQSKQLPLSCRLLLKAIKGQLISKCLFGIFSLPKNEQK